jgi:cell division protein ZapA
MPLRWIKRKLSNARKGAKYAKKSKTIEPYRLYHTQYSIFDFLTITVKFFPTLKNHVKIQFRILLRRGMEVAEKNRTSVGIYGQQYTIIGTDPANHIRYVASLVDEKMREISSRNPGLDTSKVAVLTAINAVHDFIKLKEQYELLEKEYKLKD